MKSKMLDTSNARDLSLLDEGFFDSQSEMLEKKYGLDNIDLGEDTVTFYALLSCGTDITI